MKNSDLQNSEPPKKRHSKRELAFFKSSSWLFQLSHFVKIYRQTHNNHIQVQKEKEKCVICLCYPQNNKLGAVTVVWGSEFHRSFFFSGGGEYRGGGEYGGGEGGCLSFLVRFSCGVWVFQIWGCPGFWVWGLRSEYSIPPNEVTRYCRWFLGTCAGLSTLPDNLRDSRF